MVLEQLQSEDTALPVIDVDLFRSASASSSSSTSSSSLAECRRAVEALHQYGALLVRDSRVSERDNETFIDLLEDYFSQSYDDLARDLRPEYGYQVGVTLENTEKPACKSRPTCLDLIARLEPDHRPLDLLQHESDPKARFFHRIAKTPRTTRFPRLSAPPVIPEKFKEVWIERLDAWGLQLKAAVESVAEMTALGLGLERDYLTSRAHDGPHLLAPTSSDLTRWGEKDTILAGFHTDISCFTIHGASRYPGLNIWARNTGQRIPVRIPKGCLLVQAGMQIEHLTAGYILAGYHEVVVNEATLAAIARHRTETRPAKRPLIRISSTFFWHLDSDCLLEPLATCLQSSSENEGDLRARYPTMLAGHKVEAELGLLNLIAS